MAILDVSVTNSSLQDIQVALSATLDEGSWISTAYLMTEIIVIPLSLYLAQVQGYNPFQIGQVLMWVGLPQLLIVPFVPKLIQM